MSPLGRLVISTHTLERGRVFFNSNDTQAQYTVLRGHFRVSPVALLIYERRERPRVGAVLPSCPRFHERIKGGSSLADYLAMAPRPD